MITGHNLIYFAPENWDGLWRNRQQLMSIFARHNRVLFVEPRRHLRPTLEGFQRSELGSADLRRASIRQVADNLFVFRYPIWAPISGRFPLGWFTRTVRRLSIQKALRKLEMSQPIVWFSRPDMVDLMDETPAARMVLYHVVDEYAAYDRHTPASISWIEAREKEMMALADTVVVVSEKLYQAKSPFNAHTYLVANGVDYAAYSAALTDPYVPEELQAIPSPRLGYGGLIGDRLDMSMLKNLAQDNPQWSLVFFGEARVVEQAKIWEEMLSMPNVHYLGLLEVSRVPFYLKCLDVGLMPYMQDRQSEHISPLKLYDYLAAGLPVAAMDIPAARSFARDIHLTDNPQDFAKTVRAALADVMPERVQARRGVAALHTWDARVEQLSELIQSRLAAKTSINGDPLRQS